MEALSTVAPVQAVRSSSRADRSEEHTSELQSRPHLVCRLLLEKKKSYCSAKRLFVFLLTPFTPLSCYSFSPLFSFSDQFIALSLFRLDLLPHLTIHESTCTTRS